MDLWRDGASGLIQAFASASNTIAQGSSRRDQTARPLKGAGGATIDLGSLDPDVRKKPIVEPRQLPARRRLAPMKTGARERTDTTRPG